MRFDRLERERRLEAIREAQLALVRYESAPSATARAELAVALRWLRLFRHPASAGERRLEAIREAQLALVRYESAPSAATRAELAVVLRWLRLFRHPASAGEREGCVEW
jgi:hypothetical protein